MKNANTESNILALFFYIPNISKHEYLIQTRGSILIASIELIVADWFEIAFAKVSSGTLKLRSGYDTEQYQWLIIWKAFYLNIS